MKISRALLLLAMPATLALAACGGNSAGVSNATGQTQSLRFVHGAPGATAGAANAIDIYYTTTGSTASATPLISAVSYGAVTDFSTQASTAATVTAFAAGTQTALGSCTLPQASTNDLDTVVFVNSGNATTPLTCVLFKDAVYTNAAGGQFRVHHASPAAAAGSLATVSFGLTNGNTAATFSVAGSATFPGLYSANPAAGYAAVPVNGPATAATTVGFAIGANGQPGTTTNSLAQIFASQFVAPGTVTKPDTANTLPGGGYNNGSVFAIDCGPNAQTPSGTACSSPTGGTGLIASFDNK